MMPVIFLAHGAPMLLDDAGWVAELGRPRITFVEQTAVGGGRERRVLFDGGLDVDFSIFPAALFADLPAILEQHAANGPAGAPETDSAGHALELAYALRDVARRGLRVLADKDGVLARTLPLLDRLPAAPAGPPSAHAFSETIADFWYHAVWTAKKLRRGELWVAKSCCDGYMKALLLRLLAWHAGAVRGWQTDTWHGGRFLERWAEPAALAALRDAYAHYDTADVACALLATMALFRRLTVETATALAYPNPTDAADYATALVGQLLGAVGER